VCHKGYFGVQIQIKIQVKVEKKSNILMALSNFISSGDIFSVFSVGFRKSSIVSDRNCVGNGFGVP